MIPISSYESCDGKKSSTMQGLVLNNNPSYAKECCYKSYRRRSSAFKGQGYILDPTSLEPVAWDDNENESENESTLSVSIIGLILIISSFAYAIFFSMICTTLFGWNSNPLCKVSRERTQSKTELPKSRRTSATCRNQG